MSTSTKDRSRFMDSFVVHLALRAAIRQRLFKSNAAARKSAERLLASMDSARSIYGRQMKMLDLMQNGVSLAEMIRSLRCSRRTVFRYLNQLEDAGIEITLTGDSYKVTDGLLSKMGG